MMYIAELLGLSLELGCFVAGLQASVKESYVLQGRAVLFGAFACVFLFFLPSFFFYLLRFASGFFFVFPFFYFFLWLVLNQF